MYPRSFFHRPASRRLPAPLMILALSLGACSGNESPTAPADRSAPGEPTFSPSAGDRVVNSLADPGDGICDTEQCTLREAINDPGSTRITFVSGLTGNLTLATPAAGGGPLLIAKALRIIGPTAGVVIRRRSTDPGFAILRVDGEATVTLRNLTLRGGQASPKGGGVTNWGALTLIHCTVAGSTPSGISNHGSLTLRNSTVTGNTGSGIVNHPWDHPVTLDHSAVTQNSGGGIVTWGGPVELAFSTVAHNSYRGMSIYRGRVKLLESRITDNWSGQRGGGIFVNHSSVLEITNSTLARNRSTYGGGGIAIQEVADVIISNSTIVANTADWGGGVAVDGWDDGAALTMTNSTVTRNSATWGGGIAVTTEGSATITNSTVAGNSATSSGGGIGSNYHPYLTLRNSLVAENSAPSAPDIDSQDPEKPPSAAYSLIGDGTGSGVANVDGNQVGNVSPFTLPIDPLLDDLALNGGATRTLALEAGSPALDAASAAACPPTDQRGVTRPQGPGCDIGSYERE